MSSDTTQAERNRKNALASTGPKTPEGKERSSGNRLAHGLRSKREVIPGENREEWDAFARTVEGDLKAESPTEQALARLVASNLWRLARGARFEAEVVSARSDREELKLAYEVAMDAIPFNVKIDRKKKDTESDIKGLEAKLKEAEKYFEWYGVSMEFFCRLPDEGIAKAIPEKFREELKQKMDPNENVLVDFPEEIGVLAQAPEAMLEALRDRPEKATVKDALELLKAGRNNDRKDLFEFMNHRLEEQLQKVAKLKKRIEEARNAYEEGLDRFAARFGIPAREDMERLQTYEAHLHRNLQRTLEAFAKVRELRSAEAKTDIEAVASNVKNEADRT